MYSFVDVSCFCNVFLYVVLNFIIVIFYNKIFIFIIIKVNLLKIMIFKIGLLVFIKRIVFFIRVFIKFIFLER